MLPLSGEFSISRIWALLRKDGTILNQAVLEQIKQIKQLFRLWSPAGEISAEGTSVYLLL